MAAISRQEIEAAGRALAGASAGSILQWAADRFPGRVRFGTGFGAEGCVLIDIIARRGLAIDLFTLDTGLLFPETYALWQQLEARYRISIRGVVPAVTLDVQAAQHGPALWESNPAQCCGLRKVAPLGAALAGAAAWVTAIRGDQTVERASASIVEHDARFDLVKINPLLAWTSEDVWRYLRRYDVPYNPLHDHGYPSIGCEPCTTPVLPGEHPRAGRWRALGQRECGLHVHRQAERPGPGAAISLLEWRSPSRAGASSGNATD